MSYQCNISYNELRDFMTNISQLETAKRSLFIMSFKEEFDDEQKREIRLKGMPTRIYLSSYLFNRISQLGVSNEITTMIRTGILVIENKQLPMESVGFEW